MTSSSPFEGKFQEYYKSPEYDAFAKAAGYGMVARQALKFVSPILEIKHLSDDYWTIDAFITFVTYTIKFKMGIPFENAVNGQKCRNVVTMEEEKRMVHLETDEKTGNVVQYERLIAENGDLRINFTTKGVTAYCLHKRI